MAWNNNIFTKLPVCSSANCLPCWSATVMLVLQIFFLLFFISKYSLCFDIDFFFCLLFRFVELTLFSIFLCFCDDVCFGLFCLSLDKSVAPLLSGGEWRMLGDTNGKKTAKNWCLTKLKWLSFFGHLLWMRCHYGWVGEWGRIGWHGHGHNSILIRREGVFLDS